MILQINHQGRSNGNRFLLIAGFHAFPQTRTTAYKLTFIPCIFFRFFVNNFIRSHIFWSTKLNSYNPPARRNRGIIFCLFWYLSWETASAVSSNIVLFCISFYSPILFVAFFICALILPNSSIILFTFTSEKPIPIAPRALVAVDCSLFFLYTIFFRHLFHHFFGSGRKRRIIIPTLKLYGIHRFLQFFHLLFYSFESLIKHIASFL